MAVARALSLRRHLAPWILFALCLSAGVVHSPPPLPAKESEHERLSAERADRHEIGISGSIELSGAEQNRLTVGQSVSYLFAQRLSVTTLAAQAVELMEKDPVSYLTQTRLSLGYRIRRRLPFVRIELGASRELLGSEEIGSYNGSYNGGTVITWITDPVLLTLGLTYFGGPEQPSAIRVALGLTEALNDRVALSLRLLHGAAYEVAGAQLQPPQLLVGVSITGSHWNSSVNTLLPSPPIATIEGGYTWHW